MSSESPLPVVLVGPMGAGKTTVGQAVADTLGMDFMDTDQVFTERFGPITDFFAAHGEPAFRTQEEKIIAEALQHPTPMVIALGGGAVLQQATRERLSEQGFVVFVDVEETVGIQRVSGDQARPLLAGNSAQKWIQIRQERLPLYTQVADMRIDTAHHSIEEVTQQIVDNYRN